MTNHKTIDYRSHLNMECDVLLDLRPSRKLFCVFLSSQHQPMFKEKRGRSALDHSGIYQNLMWLKWDWWPTPESKFLWTVDCFVPVLLFCVVEDQIQSLKDNLKLNFIDVNFKEYVSDLHFVKCSSFGLLLSVLLTKSSTFRLLVLLDFFLLWFSWSFSNGSYSLSTSFSFP